MYCILDIAGRSKQLNRVSHPGTFHYIQDLELQFVYNDLCDDIDDDDDDGDDKNDNDDDDDDDDDDAYH